MSTENDQYRTTGTVMVGVTTIGAMTTGSTTIVIRTIGITDNRYYYNQ